MIDPVEIGLISAGLGAVVSPVLVYHYNSALAIGATNQEYIEHFPTRSQVFFKHLAIAVLGGLSSGVVGGAIALAITLN